MWPGWSRRCSQNWPHHVGNISLVENRGTSICKGFFAPPIRHSKEKTQVAIPFIFCIKVIQEFRELFRFQCHCLPYNFSGCHICGKKYFRFISKINEPRTHCNPSICSMSMHRIVSATFWYPNSQKSLNSHRMNDKRVKYIWTFLQWMVDKAVTCFYMPTLTLSFLCLHNINKTVAGHFSWQETQLLQFVVVYVTSYTLK